MLYAQAPKPEKRDDDIMIVKVDKVVHDLTEGEQPVAPSLDEILLPDEPSSKKPPEKKGAPPEKEKPKLPNMLSKLSTIKLPAAAASKSDEGKSDKNIKVTI